MNKGNTEITNILNNINMVDTYNKNNEPILVKKGRGRPRKEHSEPVNIVTEPKKRGRKPKKEIYSIHTPSSANSKSNEDIILHFPNITRDELIKNNIIQEANDSDTDSSALIVNGDEYSGAYNCMQEKNELINKIKMLTEQVNILENRLSESNNTQEQPKYILNKYNISRMDINIINSDNGKEISLEPTNVACWLCTEYFDTLPCFIVREFRGNKYYVYGCFCSFNCAVRYNFEVDDYKVWNRYALTKKLYNDITGTDDDIPLAPPKEVLKKFGGSLSIEEFRKNSKLLTKEYRFVIPPMNTIVPYVEESNKILKKTNTYTDEELVLKRSKPLPNPRNNFTSIFGYASFQQKNAN